MQWYYNNISQTTYWSIWVSNLLYKYAALNILAADSCATIIKTTQLDYQVQNQHKKSAIYIYSNNLLEDLMEEMISYITATKIY